MIAASVVIPTRDRAELLAGCLESLTRQSFSRSSFEVIVVDNASRDATPEVSARFSDRLNLNYVQAAEPGLHVGRHAGYRAARSDILIYADDDIEAEPTWVEAVVDAFSNPGVGLVGGNIFPKFEAEIPGWLALWWSRPVYKGRALGYLSVLDFGQGRFPIDPHYVWGCNFSVRRQALETAGGFHPDALPGHLLRFRGDGETHVAVSVHGEGWTTMFDSAASVRHRVSATRMTQQYFVQRAFAQGVSDSYTAVRERGSALLSLRQRLTVGVRPMLGAVRERWRARRRHSDGAQSDLLAMRLATLCAWRDGFNFHQAALREDAHLLEWVLRKSYL